jgi:uncharacterized protein (TIGR02996 family)
VTHEESFLADIVAHPDDDAPRLVYADWLEDHGRSERAEFIRVQCELAKMPADDPRRPDWEERERVLQQGLADWEWLRPLGLHPNQVAFRRGFVEEIALEPGELLPRADRLFRRAPIRSVTLQADTTPGVFAGLADCPYLARLTSLVVHCLDDEGARALASSPHLTGLRRLWLGLDGILGDEGVEALAASAALAGLTVLHLIDSRITARAVRALARSAHLRGLTVLNLAENRIGPEAALAIAGSANFAHLEELFLDWNLVGDEGAHALTVSPHLARLRFLNLANNHLTTAAVRDLTTSSFLTRLTRLDLGNYFDDSRNTSGDEGARLLAAWPMLAQLSALGIAWNGIGPDGVRALLAAPHLGRLTHLNLDLNPVGDAGVQALAVAPNLAGLRALGLAWSRAGDAAARALAASPHLGGLTWLDFSNNEASAAARSALETRFGAALTLDYNDPRKEYEDAFGLRGWVG